MHQKVNKKNTQNLLFHAPLGFLNIIASVQTQSHAVDQQKD